MKYFGIGEGEGGARVLKHVDKHKNPIFGMSTTSFMNWWFGYKILLNRYHNEMMFANKTFLCECSLTNGCLVLRFLDWWISTTWRQKEQEKSSVTHTKDFCGKKKRAQKNGRLPGLFFVAKLSHLTMSWRGACYQKCSKILKIFYFLLFFLTCSQIALIPLVDSRPVSGYIKTIEKKRKETSMGHT